MIATAVSLYMRDTVVVACHSKRLGIPALAITDTLKPPLAKNAGVSLHVEAHQEYNPPSDTAILALIEVLIARVTSKTPNAVEIAEQLVAYSYPWMLSADANRSSSK